MSWRRRLGPAGPGARRPMLGGRRRARVLALGPGAARILISDTAPDALRAQLGTGAANLAQLLPELRDRLPDVPEPPPLQAEGARFRLFEAVASFLTRAAEARPLVVVLDDLHAADEPSLLLLRYVARGLQDSRLLVVGAYRDVDPTLRDPLTTALAELVREAHTAQIALRGLSAAERGGVRRAVHSDRAGVRPRRCDPRRDGGEPALRRRRSCTCSPRRAAWRKPTRPCASRRGSVP